MNINKLQTNMHPLPHAHIEGVKYEHYEYKYSKHQSSATYIYTEKEGKSRHTHGAKIHL